MLVDGEPVSAGLIEVDARLQWNGKLTPIISAFSIPEPHFIGHFQGNHLFFRMTVWKMGADLHIQVLEGEGATVIEIQEKVIQVAGILNDKFEGKGVRIIPGCFGEGYVFLKIQLLITTNSGDQKQKK